MAKTKTIDELTFSDDFLFCQVMKDENIARDFLSALFKKKIRKLSLVAAQSVVDNDYGTHGVRFDVEFVGDEIIYDIEMQKAESISPKEQKALLRRSRYYQSSIDTRYLMSGQPYAELPESYIVFICTFDPFGAGYAQYTQVSAIKETKTVADAGAQIVYLNAKYSISGETKELVLRLLDYIRDPEEQSVLSDSYVKRVDDKVKERKLDPGVRKIYMSLVEKLNRAKEEEREEMVSALMQNTGCSREDALTVLGISPPTDVKAVRESMTKMVADSVMRAKAADKRVADLQDMIHVMYGSEWETSLLVPFIDVLPEQDFDKKLPKYVADFLECAQLARELSDFARKEGITLSVESAMPYVCAYYQNGMLGGFDDAEEAIIKSIKEKGTEEDT